MPTEKLSVELKGNHSDRLLNAIEKVRLQKQRPSIERIHRVLRQLDPDLSMTDVSIELEKAVKEGIILKVITNNLCSYKLQPSSSSSSTSGNAKQKRNSLPVLKVLPSQEFFDTIVSLVNSLDSCSLEMLESQLQRKYALEMTGDLSLRQELRDCCRKLVKIGRLRKDGQYFCHSSKRQLHDPDSVSESTVWKNPTICLEDCTSGKLQTSTSIERFKKTAQRRKANDRDGDIDETGFSSGEQILSTGSLSPKDELLLDDLYTFPYDRVQKSPLKARQRNLHSMWQKSRTQADQTSQQKISEKNCKGKKFPEEFNCVDNFKGNRLLATCDSTTSHATPVQVASSLESQSLMSLNSSSELAKDIEKEENAVIRREEKPKKRSRSLQLAFLYDSLSKFFTASGEKRSAVQRTSQSLNDAGVRPMSQAGSMSLRGSVIPKVSYIDQWHSEKQKKDKLLTTLKPFEKSKTTQRKMKKTAKELNPKQGHSLTKSGGGGGAGEVFTSSSLTDDYSKLFKIAQTIAQERLLVTCGNLQLEVETKFNRTRVVFGKYELESPQQISFLPECSWLSQVYICEFCLKCLKTKLMLQRHMQKCGICHPPGEELYRDNSLSVFEVHGNKEPVFCRHLILFARLFLDHPGLYCRVSQTIYYITTVSDSGGCHLVGFYSKEKLGEHNLACLLVLPQHRGKGFGHFMIHMSYWLSSTDEMPRYPKPPLTDAAKWIYHSVWKRKIIECIEREDLTEITVRVVSCLTGIRDEDVKTMLCELGLMCEDDASHRVVTLTPALREILQIKAEEKVRQIEFNPNAFLVSRLTRKLRGKPCTVKRNNKQLQMNMNPSSSAKRRRCFENVEPVDGKPEILGSNWKAVDSLNAVIPSPKRKMGWLKHSICRQRAKKSDSVGCHVPDKKATEIKKTSTEIFGNKLDFEPLHCDGKSVEMEDVSTSTRMTRCQESSVNTFEGAELHLDVGENEELLSDHEGSIISEMPQLDEKENILMNSDNDLDFGRSPSPPQLEQELPSPYFCTGSYMRHGLDIGSKDAESVLSDCLAGRSVAPSPCFSADEAHLKSDKRVTDDESDSEMSALYDKNDTEYKGQSSQQRTVKPSSPSEDVEESFTASRASNSDNGSLDENSLLSTGFSGSSSPELQTFVKDNLSSLESSASTGDKLLSVESLNSNDDKMSSVKSPDWIRDKSPSLSSTNSNKDKSSPVESPVVSLKEKSTTESPVSSKDKPSSSVASPSVLKANSLSASPGSVKGGSLTNKRQLEELEKIGTQGTVNQSPSDGENHSQCNPEDLPCQRSSVFSLPLCSVPVYSGAERRKDISEQSVERGSNMESILQESVLPPVKSIREKFVDESRITPRPANDVRDSFCAAFTDQSHASVVASQQNQLPMISRGSASSHNYAANDQTFVMSPPMSHNSQMVNSTMSHFDSLSVGTAIARRQQCHQPMLTADFMSEGNVESSPSVTSSTVRTFSEPIGPHSVLMEAMSPHSFQLKNGLPSRAVKSGNNVTNSFSHCNDQSSILAPNSLGTNASRHAISANAAAVMVGTCSGGAALSPGYMNSMTPSPMDKGLANAYGQSKSSTLMPGRSNSGRPDSSQVAATRVGNFGHQQMSKQIMSNKYSKAMASNIQMQNLSSCGLYGLPKSSPSIGVPQGISNSSPNVNYSAVQNLSPSNSEHANASFHSLAGHNRNLVNASPARACSNKQYTRNMQHGTSRGFNTGGGGGGGGTVSPSPKQSGLGAIYQLQSPQAPSPHQIQTPAPYMHGAVQHHIGDQFSSGPESFSRQQGYMFQATYLAKLQQLTNDLGPFQTHYAMALPANMSPSPIDMTLPSHASPQRNMTPPNLSTHHRHSTKQQVHRGGGGGGGSQHKGAPAAAAAAAAASAAPGFLPDMPGSDVIARYQLLSGYHVQQPMTCPSFIHQGSPSQIPMQVGVMNVGMHPGQPSPNFMSGVQGQPNSAMYAAYGYINGGLAPQPFNMHLNDLMRR